MNKNGQSIIEYTLIAVLVILGVVYMGPYVLRSVNAHYKLWDDTVQDSLTEQITQANINDVPYVNLTCDCWDTAGQCGSNAPGAQCGASQMIYTHNCSTSSVQGCDGQPKSSCKEDQSCCLEFWQQSCGTITLPSPSGPPAGVHTFPTGATGSDSGFSTTGCVTYDPNVYPDAATNCFYGQKIYATECANPNITCCPLAACAPICEGIDSPGVIACPNATSTLVKNTGLNYVETSTLASCGSDSSCTYCNETSSPCQVYCAPGYVLNATKTACENEFTVAASIDGYLAQPSNPCAPGNWTSTYAGQSCKNTANTGGSFTTINDRSFQMCAAPNTVITAATLQDIPPDHYPYCGNPGYPTQECEVVFNYH